MEGKNIRKVLTFLNTCIFLFTLLVKGFAFPSSPPPEPRSPEMPAPPGPGYVWTPFYRHPSGIYIGGFWRVPHREGYVWIEGYLNEDGEWVFGFWKPVKIKNGRVWVPGYWDGTKWINGYWRPARKPGYIWVPGHYNKDGVWMRGKWEKH